MVDTQIQVMKQKSLFKEATKMHQSDDICLSVPSRDFGKSDS